MSPVEKKEMVRRDHPQLSISQQCRLVKLPRSSFYYSPVGIDAETLELMKEIDVVFTKYPFFGSRQIAAFLRREEGKVVGRHRVRRLMAKMGLEAISHLQAAQHFKGSSAASSLSILVEEDEDRPAKPSMVLRYHIHTGSERLSVSGRRYGLGNEESLELEAIKYASCRLVC